MAERRSPVPVANVPPIPTLHALSSTLFINNKDRYKSQRKCDPGASNIRTMLTLSPDLEVIY